MRTVPAKWQNAILVCRKCTKKLRGGFGRKGRTSLAKALRAEAGGGKGRKAAAGVVEIGCLGICPAFAVTVVDGSRPGTWLVVKAGTPIDEVADRLALGRKPAKVAEALEQAEHLRSA